MSTNKPSKVCEDVFADPRTESAYMAHLLSHRFNLTDSDESQKKRASALAYLENLC